MSLESAQMTQVFVAEFTLCLQVLKTTKNVREMQFVKYEIVQILGSQILDDKVSIHCPYLLRSLTLPVFC